MSAAGRTQLPNRRWLKRGEVIEFLGSFQEFKLLVKLKVIVPVVLPGMKQKRYVRAQVLAAVEQE